MNVLLITADQWRGECLSVLDHPCVKTPTLDALAGDGVLFRRHYTQATPCGPSRASLLTGLYLKNHRVVANGTPLDRRFTNIAEEMSAAGRESVLFGYTDIAADPRYVDENDPSWRTPEGILSGFEPVAKLTEDFADWRDYLLERGYDFNRRQGNGVSMSELDVFEPDRGDPASEGRGRSFAPARYTADHSHNAFLTDKMMDWLADRSDDRPWFSHVTYLAPHPPFIAPAPYHEMYHPDEVPPPVRAASVEDEANQHPYLQHYLYNQVGSAYTHGFDAKDHRMVPDQEVLQARATYYGMMSEVDFHIGRLLDHLKQIGSYDDTLIIFTSDHGEQLGDHWQFSKFSYFEQTFFIPLIIRAPGAAARGVMVDAFTENVDIMPTILDLAGREIPTQCDGESLSALVHSGATPDNWRDHAFCEYDFRDYVHMDGAEAGKRLKPDQCYMSILRGKRYKYVHFTALPPLLFDMEEDPGELHNLADDLAYQPILLEHARRLLDKRMLHADRLLANTKITYDGVQAYSGARA